MTGFKITKDHYNPAGDDYCRARKIFGDFKKADKKDLIPFRTYSDDMELSYSGLLIDDDECESQFDALEYAQHDMGDTIIKVKREGKWIREID